MAQTHEVTASAAEVPPNVPFQAGRQNTYEPVTTSVTGISQQFAFIDTSGICTSCEDADAHKVVLKCFLCAINFHAVCRDAHGDKSGNDIICTRSFFNSYDRTVSSEIYKTRPGNFVFICDGCMTNHEQGKTVKQETKVDIIDKRVNKLSESIEEMKSLLNRAITSPNVSPASTPLAESFSSVLQKPLKRSVLLLDSESVTHDELETVDQIISENSIHVDKLYQSKSGSTVFVCPTEDDRKNLSEKLLVKFPSVKTSIPTERLPTIGIANLTTAYKESELSDVILLAHPDIKAYVENGDSFQVLNVKRHRKNENKYQATIRVSTNIRRAIELKGDRIYIGSFSCRVFDRFHVKRCNHCQKYNHYKSECKESKPTCGFCSLHHVSDHCTQVNNKNFYPCCSNCKNTKFDSEKHSHTSFDRTCPAYVAEQAKLRKSISFYNTKN